MDTRQNAARRPRVAHDAEAPASDYIDREWWCCAGGEERSERKFDPCGLRV